MHPTFQAKRLKLRYFAKVTAIITNYQGKLATDERQNRHYNNRNNLLFYDITIISVLKVIHYYVQCHIYRSANDTVIFNVSINRHIDYDWQYLKKICATLVRKLNEMRNRFAKV